MKRIMLVSLLTQVVNPEVELADVHLGVLRLGLRVLQPVVDDLDLLLEIQTITSL